MSNSPANNMTNLVERLLKAGTAIEALPDDVFDAIPGMAAIVDGIEAMADYADILRVRDREAAARIEALEKALRQCDELSWLKVRDPRPAEEQAMDALLDIRRIAEQALSSSLASDSGEDRP